MASTHAACEEAYIRWRFDTGDRHATHSLGERHTSSRTGGRLGPRYCRISGVTPCAAPPIRFMVLL